MINKTYFHAAVLSTLALLAGCRNKPEQAAATAPIRVNVYQLNDQGSGHAQAGIQYNGTIQADKTIDLSFQVAGTITAFPVQTGQYVKKGQLLASVDETVYRNQYEAQQAQARLAEENYRRVLEVYKKGSIAEINMLDAKSKYEQASAAARATYQNIAHTRIYAPRNGYVGSKRVEAGATASPGMPVLQLLDISDVAVLVAIPEGEISRYKKGDRASVRVDALGDRVLEGRVSEIGVLGNQGSASYNLKVRLDNPEQSLRPGMLCTVSFPGTAATSQSSAQTNTQQTSELVIPTQAVLLDEKGQQFVFIADANSSMALRKNVQTGALYSNGIVITKGLSGSEQVITNGFQKLTDSTAIEVIR